MRRFPALFLLALLALPFSAAAQDDARENEALQPMAFKLMEKCEEGECERVALGQGRIVPGTTARMAAFLKQNDGVHKVFLHSPGGFLAEGLRLGIALREAGLDTALTDEMLCYSACAYAFLGGVSREVQPGGHLGVHRFYSDQVAGDDDIGDAQRVGVMLAEYVQGMGIERDILDVAASYGGENIYSIDTAKARALGVDNHGLRPASWTLTPSDDGPMVLMAKGASLGSDRQGMVTIGALEGGMAVGVFLREPPFHSPQRLTREMQNTQMVVCRHDAAGNVRREKCAAGTQLLAWKAPEEGVRGAMFAVEQEEFARVLEGSVDDGVTIVIYGGAGGDELVLMLNTKAEGLRGGVQTLLQ